MLDLTWPVAQWPVTKASQDAVYCSNVCHISAWSCTLGLFCGSAKILRPDGLLLIYGPFAVDGVLTPDSNALFDLSLRSQNPEWGIRDVADLKKIANEVGLEWVRSYDMPANNKILVFKKKESESNPPQK